MSRSLLKTGKTVIFILAAVVFSCSYVSNAQDKRPMRANQKTVVEPEKKGEHKRHAAIKHRRGGNKELQDIKAGNNKAKK